MPNELKELFDAEVPTIPAAPSDVAGIVTDGRKRLRRRRLAGFSSAIVIIGVVGLGATQILGNERRLPIGARPGPSATDSGPIYEEISERDRAEIFAFRALAANGLMDPYGKRHFLLSDADDTRQTDSGWQIGLATSDCEPADGTFTCTGLAGEDPEGGHALRDAFITVALQDGNWRVVDLIGNVAEAEAAKVIGYTLPDQREPTHWEFPAVGVWNDSHGTSISAHALWVGPNPTSAPGSACVLTTFDDEGEGAEPPRSFFQEPPAEWFDTAGMVWGTGSEREFGVASAVVNCQQYSGATWEITSGPELVGDPGAVSGVFGELTWRGDPGVTTGATCRATLLDENGEEVWSGSGKVHPLWREDELKNYPYRAPIHVLTDGEEVDAHSIGEFTCESR